MRHLQYMQPRAITYSFIANCLFIGLRSNPILRVDCNLDNLSGDNNNANDSKFHEYDDNDVPGIKLVIDSHFNTVNCVASHLYEKYFVTGSANHRFEDIWCLSNFKSVFAVAVKYFHHLYLAEELLRFFVETTVVLVVDGCLYDYNGFNFCLAATNNNERKKKYDKGVSNTPHAAPRLTSKREKEVKYYTCCDLICNIIGGLIAPAKERDVEYYYCCDLICDLFKFGTGVPIIPTELCPLNMDTGIH